MLERLTQNRRVSFTLAVGRFGMEKDDDRFADLLVDLLVRYIGKRF
jgi:hypothetical protein